MKVYNYVTIVYLYSSEANLTIGEIFLLSKECVHINMHVDVMVYV